jgi:hypothetical protein
MRSTARFKGYAPRRSPLFDLQGSCKGKEKPPKVLALLVAVTFFAGCATLYETALQKPFAREETLAIVSGMEDQEKRVSSFYAAGKLVAKNWWYGETESDILIAGNREPLRLKIEITHPWGQPILHILIHPGRLEVLTFAERRVYLGEVKPDILSKFLPGELDPELIWAALRGYPGLRSHKTKASLKANQITLFDEKEGEVEIIDFYPENTLPRSAYFPSQDVKMWFSDFQASEGIFYAREVRVDHARGRGNLILRTRGTVLNRTIPGEIFTIEKPPGFETHYLD